MNFKRLGFNFRWVSIFILLVLSFASLQVQAQNCTVNAGTPQSICPGTPFLLHGLSTSSGGFFNAVSPVWSQVAGPAVTISAPVYSGNQINATVTGYAPGNSYTFRISARCADGSQVFQDVVYTTLVATTSHAGANLSSACPGTVTMAANAVSAGETGTWSIIGQTNGVSVNSVNSPTTTITLPTSPASVTTFRWTITNTNGCISSSDKTITNNGGATPVTAGTDQVLSNCYNLTQATQLGASYAGNGTNGQQGTWTFVSGPSTPSFDDIHGYNTFVRSLVQGTYTLRWTVAGPCVTGVDEMTITVPAPTQSVTNASNANLVFCDSRTSTVLSATAPGYTNETATWTLHSGTGTISDPNAATTTITGLTPGSPSVFYYTIYNTSTNCNTTGAYNISYTTQTAIDAIPDIVVLQGGISFTSIPFTASGGNQTQWQLLTSVAGSTIALSTTAGYHNIFSSPLDLTGLDKIGEYTIRLQRTTNNGAGGCVNAYDDVTIIASLPPTAANAGTTQLVACNVFSATLAGNVAASGVGSWSQVSGPNQAIIFDPTDPGTAISGLTNGAYVFRWFISGGQGTSTAQADVTVKVADVVPTVANAGPDASVCNGTPIKLSGNTPALNETGTWTVTPSSGVGFVNVNDPGTKVTGLAGNSVYTFTWTITNSCGTSHDDAVITTSNTAGPKQALAGSSQCLSSTTTTFNLAGNAPAGTETGAWALVSGPNTPTITSSTSATTTVTGAIDGTYKFEWSLTTPSCSATRDTLTITASAAATTATVISPVNLCGATQITLAGNDPIIGTGIWTQVTGVGGAVITTPTLSSSTVTGIGTGSYTFRWTISNGACSSNSADVRYNISAPPTVATLTGITPTTQSLCGVTSTVLNGNTITVGTGLWQVVSGPNTPTFSSISNPTATLSGLIMGTYVLRWTSSNGANCPKSVSPDLTIYVTQNATANVIATGLCNVTTVELTGNAGSAGTWSFVTGAGSPTLLSSSLNTAIASGLTNGSYTYRYTLPAVGVCVATSATVTFTITASPSIAQAGVDQQVCGGTSVILGGTTPSIGTGTWTIISQPVGSLPSFSNTNAATSTFSNLDPGVYLLQWNVTNGFCGTNQDIVRITTFATPTTAVAGSNQLTACTGNITLSGNTPTVGVGTWSQVSGLSATIDAPNAPTTAVIGTSPGIYSFMWTISNGICAASTSTVTITVTSTPPNPAVAGPDQQVCNISTTASAVLAGSTPVGGETGAWTIASKPLAASPTFGDATLYNTTVSNLIAGTYQFTWTVSNGSCVSSSNVTITVTDQPTPANAGPDKSFCLYSPVALAATAVSTGVGAWSVTSQPVSTPDPVFSDVNSNTTTVNGLLSGDYVFTWVTTNGSACAVSMSSVTIHIVPPPSQALAGSFQTVCFGVNPTLTANLPTVGTGSWAVITTAGGTPAFTDVNAYNSVVTGLVAGVYTFSWTITNGGCTSSDQTQVTIQPAIANNIISAPQTICSGSTPVGLTGTITTGGNGTFTYQWEQSTTNASSGFSAITGATGSSYSPPVLTATTWYRRVVSSGFCSGATGNTSTAVQITVQPPLTGNGATAPATTTFCQSGDPDIILGGTPGGGDGVTYTYLWEQSTTSAVAGFSAITGVTTQDYDPPVLTATTWFRRTLSSGSCVNVGTAVKITINPYAVLTSAVSPAAICSGASFSYSPTASIGGTTFSWSRAAIATINANAGGSGTQSITETLTSTDVTIVPVQYLYTLTTTLGCTNPTAFSVTVNVRPTPNVNLPSNQTLCNGLLTAAINFTGSVVANTTYNWTNNKASIGLAASGTGNIGVFTATNSTNVPVIATLVVTPVSNTCSGTPQTFTITVNPTPAITAMVTTICTGATFLVTPTNSTNGVVPAGTTYSWSAPTVTGTLTAGASGAAAINISGTLSHTDNTAQTATYIVTPNTAACGDGPVFTVTVTVNPVADITDMITTVCAGVTFTVTPANVTNGRVPAGTKYTWSTPAGSGFTGGASQGGGGAANISGNLTNNISTATTATYTVTPTSATCAGNPFTVTVSLNPKGILLPISITTCSGIAFATTPVDGSGNILPSGTTFSWSAPTGSNFTGGASNAGPIGGIFGSLINTVNASRTATYLVTPLSGSCTGNIFSTTITLNPVVAVTDMTTVSCSGVSFTVTPTNLTNGIVPAGTTYTWSAPTVTGSLTGGGAGSNATNISGTLSVSSTSAETATYTVTPATSACGSGAAFTVTVTIRPVAVISAMSTVTCGGIPFVLTPTNGVDGVIPSGTTYSWPAPSGSFSGAALGTNAVNISGTLTNTVNTATTATYVVTPKSTGNCSGTPFTVIISLNPKAIITNMTAIICNGASFTVTPTQVTNGIVPAATTYSWSAPLGSGFTGGAAGSGLSNISGTLANSSNAAKSATYTVTPLSGSCTGNTFQVTVTVNPIAAVTDMTGTTCSGVIFNITPVDVTNGTIPSGTLYSWPPPTGTGFTGGATQVASLSSLRGNLTNTTSSAVTALYTVTPISGACTGAAFSVTVTINPVAGITAMSVVGCNGVFFNVTPTDVTNGIVPAGTTYSWPVPGGVNFSGGASKSTQNGIFGTLTNTVNTATTATYTVTPLSGTCTGASFTLTVTLNPSAVITAMSATICTGTTFTVTPVNSTNGIVPLGTTYSWSAPSVTGTLSTGASGSAASNISGTLSHTNTTAQTATYTITPNTAACGNGATFTVTVTVNPVAAVTDITTVTCSGVTFTVTPANVTNGIIPAGTKYTWTTPGGSGFTGGAAQAISTTTVTGTLTNTTTAPATATYTVTPISGTCAGIAFSVIVTLNPTPVLSGTLLPSPICNNATFSYTATSATAGTSFAWTRTVTGGITSGGGATGTGDVNQTLTNANTSPTLVPYTYTLTANGCSNVQAFSVTVNPSALLTSTVTPSAICNITSFSYTATSSTAGTSFAWSRPVVTGITSGGGATGTANILQTLTSSNAVPTQVAYVYTLTANGCTNPNPFTVTVVVNPTPDVASGITDQVLCNGTLTAAATFTGSVANTTYNWTNTLTAIGLAGSGSGTINAFTTTNAGIIPVIAIITVTPFSNSCNGTPRSFSITVNPTPTVNIIASQTICNGISTTAVTFSGAVTSTTYNWVNTAPSIGLGASGAGNISSFAGTNASSVPVTAFITVTPVSNTCNGSTPRTFSITVNPTPTANQVSDQVVCNGTLTSAVNYTGFVAGTTYNWTNNTTSIGLAASGSGTIAAFTGTNITSSPVTALITVTPVSNTCAGTTMLFSITVNPTASLTSTLSPSAVCSNTVFSYTATSAVTGTSFSWARNTVSGITSGGPATGTGNINQTLINSNNVQTNVGYVYTLTANGCANPLTFTVTVPVSAVASINAMSTAVCGGVTFSVTPTNGTDGIVPAGTTYTWTAPAGSGFSGGALQGTGVSTITGNLTNTTSSTATAVYQVTPVSGACTGTVFTVTVTLAPKAIVNALSSTTCSGVSFAVTPVDSSDGIVPAGTTYTWTPPTGAGFIGALSGAGAGITGTLTNTTNTVKTATYLVTPTSGSCTGNVVTLTVNINPAASVTAMTGTSCSGVAFTFTPVNSTNGIVPAGTTYSWPVPAVTGGMTGAASATGATSINGTLSNLATNTAQTATYTVTPTTGCGAGTPFTVTVSIRAVAYVNAMSVTTCSGVGFVVAPGNVTDGVIPAGTTYSWSVPTGAGITGGVSASAQATVNGTLTNTGTALATAIYSVTPLAGVCSGAAFTVTVNLNPAAILSSTLTPAAICNTTTFSYTATSATAGTSFAWSRTTVAGITSGGPATGTGNISQTLTNSTTAPLSIQYVYSLTANGCTNPATATNTVTVVVNPTPILTSTLTPATIFNATTFSYTATSATPGTTYAWTRAAITTINSNTPGSGASGVISEVLTNTNPGLVNVVYAFTLTANGCTNAQTVTVGVSPTPVLSSTQTPSAICSGTLFAYTATSATPTTTFTWSRAGIANINGNATGSGVTAAISETLTNTSTVPVSVVYSVMLTANGFSNTQNVTVVVNPTPSVNQPGFQLLCNNTLTTGIVFSGSVSGTTYNWSNDNTAIGLAATGSGTIASFTATNSTTANITALITVTPVSNTCAGTPVTFSITVKPTPVLSSTLTPAGICTGSTFTYAATSATAGTSYTWSRTIVTGIVASGAATGTGNVSTQTLTNSTTAPLSAGYVYTLTANSCTNIQTVTVAVNPTPVLTSTLTPTAVYGGTPLVYTPTSATPGTTYTWTRAAIASIDNPAAGGTGSINETLYNNSASPANVIYVYTLTANGCSNMQSITAVINQNNTPLDPGTIGSSQTICTGSTAASFTSTTGASGGAGIISYQWQQSSDNTTFTNIAGAVTAVYSAGALTQTTYYRRTASTTFNGSFNTPSVKVTVLQPPVITGGIIGDCAVSKDTLKTYSVAPALNATNYAWSVPTGWSGTSTTSSLTVHTSSASVNGNITVTPFNGTCAGNPVSYQVAVIDFARVTIGSTPGIVKGDNNSSSTVTIVLYDINGNPIHCSGGIASLCTSSGTFTTVVDNGDGTYTSTLRSSANSAVICGSVGGVMIQQTVTTVFTGPQGSIKGNGPIFETETPLLTFNFTAGIGPFTVVYHAQGSTTNDTLNNVTSNVAIPVKSITATKLYTMVSIIGSDNARRDNNFTKDTATIIVVEPKIVVTLTADNPKFLADNLYSTILRIKVKNIGAINLSSVQVKANLIDVFPNPVQFILDSVNQSGIKTVPNNQYDGRQNLDLFSWNSRPGKRAIPDNIASAAVVPPLQYGYSANTSASLTDAEAPGKQAAEAPFLPNYTQEKYEAKDNTTAGEATGNGPLNTGFFFGTLSKLDAGVESDMLLYVRIVPNGYFKPFVMQVVAVGTGNTEFGTALANSLSNDDGNAATHPEVTGKGEPLPTVINVFPNPVLGVALQAGTPVVQLDGTYNVPLSYVLQNYGNVNLRSVTLLENLLRSIGSPASFHVVGTPVASDNLIANPGYDGKIDTNLLAANSSLGVGLASTVTITINITPNQLSALYRLQATGTGLSRELNSTVTDLSNNGTNPDPDGNGIPDEKLITLIPINMSIPPLVPGKIGIKNPPSGTVLTIAFCTPSSVVVIPTSLNTGGVDPYTYQWQTSADNTTFTNITGATDSTYTSGIISTSVYLRRSVISGNQQAYSNSVYVQIYQVTKPVISASGSLNLTQSGSITLTSTPASAYLWSTSASTRAIAVATAGAYTVTATDANGCKATSDLVAINPPPPTTVNAIYIIGATTNPPNSGVQVTGLTGATLKYYILSTGGTLIPVPVLPGVIGVYAYYVSQVVNGYESVLVPYTVTMLDPNKVADLQKITTKGAQLQADGSYIVNFTFLASNLRSELLDSVKIKDDLTKVFPSSVNFETVGIKASGKLIANELYNGSSQIELLSNGSQLPGLQTDSVELSIKVYPNGFSGLLNNTAIQVAKSPYGTFSVISNDPTAGNGLTVRQLTKFIIPATDIFIPSGFSPNRDGVNDLFVITRPFNTTISLEVFNRWGNLVYRSADYNNQWNGKGNQPNNILGEDLPDGTYYYIVLATDKTTGALRKFAGFITLKR